MANTARSMFKPVQMMRQARFNFMTLNQNMLNAQNVQLSRNFCTKEGSELMDNLEDISEWETKVIQNDKLVLLQASATW
eukprot:CAMPEP_0196996472 /NCGR_PEP_ID=MMETSP1380-20130617/2337_1 /TAXON_ID=5936 /ORGANISM="Euplotes crassus, Strain CT5" /LENGTH=78 /DNA_ID=CAMNT_0042412443 /DNA_START=42 /DNA_END=275 /DNA_ORIENTATION=+